MLHTFMPTVLGYLRELAEIVVVGFVIAGVINAVMNKQAVARYLGGKLRQGITCAIDMLPELGLWTVLGVVLGAAIETFVPEHVFTHYLGGASLLGLLAALIVAGIFSSDSLGSLPWVQSLLTKGLGAGSAMILHA